MRIREQRGVALYIVMALTGMLALVLFGLLAVFLVQEEALDAQQNQVQATYLLDSGIALAQVKLQANDAWTGTEQDGEAWVELPLGGRVKVEVEEVIETMKSNLSETRDIEHSGIFASGKKESEKHEGAEKVPVSENAPVTEGDPGRDKDGEMTKAEMTLAEEDPPEKISKEYTLYIEARLKSGEARAVRATLRLPEGDVLRWREVAVRE